MRLVRTRECDGRCCDESPRFPNSDGTKCIYHVDNGCQLQRDPSLIPESKIDWFIKTCLQWPEFWPAGRGTAGCCLQWVDNGN